MPIRECSLCRTGYCMDERFCIRDGTFLTDISDFTANSFGHTCSSCGAIFAPNFNFCPRDGTVLEGAGGGGGGAGGAVNAADLGGLLDSPNRSMIGSAGGGMRPPGSAQKNQSLLNSSIVSEAALKKKLAAGIEFKGKDMASVTQMVEAMRVKLGRKGVSMGVVELQQLKDGSFVARVRMAMDPLALELHVLSLCFLQAQLRRFLVRGKILRHQRETEAAIILQTHARRLVHSRRGATRTAEWRGMEFLQEKMKEAACHLLVPYLQRAARPGIKRKTLPFFQAVFKRVSDRGQFIKEVRRRRAARTLSAHFQCIVARNTLIQLYSLLWCLGSTKKESAGSNSGGLSSTIKSTGSSSFRSWNAVQTARYAVMHELPPPSSASSASSTPQHPTPPPLAERTGRPQAGRA